LTPYCGLEVQKPVQALKSVKDPGNTFDINPKWSRTLPSLIYFSWDIYRDPHSIEKNKISKLIFDKVGCQISTLIFEENNYGVGISINIP
jgi:hypothetical protein